MALCLADTYAAKGRFDYATFADALVRWYRQSENLFRSSLGAVVYRLIRIIVVYQAGGKYSCPLYACKVGCRWCRSQV